LASVSDYIEVDAPVDRCYQYWRDFTNFPNFMEDVRRVTPTGPNTWRWEVDGPLGKRVEWEAELAEDIPNRKIAWRTVGEGTVDTAGNVQFEDKDGRTALTIALSYDPPAGVVGEMAARMTSNDPQDQVRRSLERFRSITEGWSTAA
jgi:uncharacterized membrane protein